MTEALILTSEDIRARKQAITIQWLQQGEVTFTMNGKMHHSQRANTCREHLLSRCGYDPNKFDLFDANGKRYSDEIIILLEGMPYTAKEMA